MVTKNNVKMIIVFACGIALCLAAAACRKKSRESEPTEEPAIAELPAETESKSDAVETPHLTSGDLEAFPLFGLGPVKFGMSKEQVIEYLGEPERTEGQGVALYYLESIGVSLLLNPRRGLRSFDCWSKEYPLAQAGMVTFAGKTDKGIKMGATREQIIAAYGQADETYSAGPLETLRYDQLLMQFVLADNKLVNFRLTAPP
ncbi:MAG: hypothetical protein ACYS76_09370 [Planctomycetota bacterium]